MSWSAFREPNEHREIKIDGHNRSQACGGTDRSVQGFGIRGMDLSSMALIHFLTFFCNRLAACRPFGASSFREADLKARRRRRAVVAALEPVEASIAGPEPRANPRAKPQSALPLRRDHRRGTHIPPTRRPADLLLQRASPRSCHLLFRTFVSLCVGGGEVPSR